MPFTSEGIVPDVIINPNAFPSRMTINQLIESAFGKYCTINGEIGDCSPFTTQSKNIGEIVPELLSKTKYSRAGTEKMFCGFTGEEIESPICIGITMYQCLKHMVEDKWHVRNTGKYTELTRQPLEGRRREGGMRFGEMERDCVVARGLAGMTQERLCKVSDQFNIPVCKKCHNITNTSNDCNVCGSSQVVRYNIPYASKLLLQLLQGMGMKVAIDYLL
jgi:DNA-directed RNA polymerase II subunit RPB2